MMVAGFLKFTFVLLDVPLVVVGVSQFVQMTAEGGLGFVLLGPDHTIQTVLAAADVGVAPEEIHRARAEAKQLRQDRVVVVVL